MTTVNQPKGKKFCTVSIPRHGRNANNLKGIKDFVSLAALKQMLGAQNLDVDELLEEDLDPATLDKEDALDELDGNEDNEDEAYGKKISVFKFFPAVFEVDLSQT